MKMARRETAEVFVSNNDTGEEIQIENNDSNDSEVEKIEEKVNNDLPKRDYSTSREKLETVRVNANHSCYIGGTYYVFKKGAVYQVPSDVKRILTVANLLAPL